MLHSAGLFVCSNGKLLAHEVNFSWFCKNKFFPGLAETKAQIIGKNNISQELNFLSRHHFIYTYEATVFLRPQVEICISISLIMGMVEILLVGYKF